jgi:hypothetical protein
LGNLFARLGVAFVITLAVSMLVLAALPAGRSAIRHFKQMVVLLFTRERHSPAQG